MNGKAETIRSAPQNRSCNLDWLDSFLDFNLLLLCASRMQDHQKKKISTVDWFVFCSFVILNRLSMSSCPAAPSLYFSRWWNTPWSISWWATSSTAMKAHSRKAWNQCSWTTPVTAATALVPMPLEYQRLVNKLVQTLLLPYGNQFKIPTIYERLIQLVDCYGQRPHINPPWPLMRPNVTGSPVTSLVRIQWMKAKKEKGPKEKAKWER